MSSDEHCTVCFSSVRLSISTETQRHTRWRHSSFPHCWVSGKCVEKPLCVQWAHCEVGVENERGGVGLKRHDSFGAVCRRRMGDDWNVNELRQKHRNTTLSQHISGNPITITADSLDWPFLLNICLEGEEDQHVRKFPFTGRAFAKLVKPGHKLIFMLQPINLLSHIPRRGSRMTGTLASSLSPQLHSASCENVIFQIALAKEGFRHSLTIKRNLTVTCT